MQTATRSSRNKPKIARSPLVARASPGAQVDNEVSGRKGQGGQADVKKGLGGAALNRKRKSRSQLACSDAVTGDEAAATAAELEPQRVVQQDDATMRLAMDDEEDEEEEGEQPSHPTKLCRKDDAEDGDLAALAIFARYLNGTGRQAAHAVEVALAPRPFLLPLKRSEIARLKKKPQKIPVISSKAPATVPEKPKPYHRIRKMAIHESVADRAEALLRDDQVAHCQCVSAKEAKRNKIKEGGVDCNEDCVNRLLCIECTSETCALARAGTCKNQRMAKRQTKACKVFKTEHTGWGVKAMEDIEVGELIMEFVGEVISTEECDRRMEEEDEEATPDLYFVDIGGAVVDAGRMGNDARFVNHSCDPNSQLQKWSVDGHLKLGIFAIKPIAKDDQITYNYAFCHYSTNPMKCQCGAESCAGLLTTKPPASAMQQTPEEEKLRAQEAEAEDFREAIAHKVHLMRAPQSSLTSFFNGRPDDDEVARGSFRRARLFLVGNGRLPKGDVLKKRLQALMIDYPPAKDDSPLQTVLAELGTLAGKKKTRKSGGARPLFGPIGARKGLATLRKRRIVEASQLTFLKKLRAGGATIPEWPAKRWEALADMVDLVEEPAESGVGTMDLNEDLCAGCGGAGELLLCDGCTLSYHLTCANLFSVPEGTWLCPRCRG